MHDETAITDHDVVLLAPDRVSLFEFAVACDVFTAGRSLEFGVPWYDLRVAGARRAVTTDQGIRLQVPHGLDALASADTVVVPPTDAGAVSPMELDALRAAHDRGARILSLCTGAFVLAEAGLLDGRRATTHWAECADLARRYPAVDVDPDVLFVQDGAVLTSAGSAASIDLCLHVVRTDRGAEVATRLARELVVPLQRPGGQAQFIEDPLPDLDDTDRFDETLTWMRAHLDEPLTVEDAAARALVSPRTFARRFADRTGTTPHQWLLRERVRLAQRLLETSDLPVETVARQAGLGSADNLRKRFRSTVRTTPLAYRRTFRSD